MSRVASATAVPDEGALLCEGCGYILEGLPQHSVCPECAKPITDSLASRRSLPDWEREGDGPRFRRFLSTTAAVLFRPAAFYRGLATRGRGGGAARFARRHYLMVTALFSAAAVLQLHWLCVMPGYVPGWRQMMYWDEQTWAANLPKLLLFFGGGFVGFFIFLYAFIAGTTYLAGRLTAWEAAYRGLRLPLAVVMRGLHYHSAHYLPVALLAFATVAGYQALLATQVLSDLHATRYLYVLCAEVVLAAAYLFKTYWTGMRNMLYANG